MRNLKKVFLSVGLLLVIGCSFAQQKNKHTSYTITAQIDNLPDGTIFYLIKTNESGGPDTVRHTLSYSGQFKFDIELSLPGEMYWIRIDTAKKKLEKGQRDWLGVLLDSSFIKITGNMKSWPNLKIEGSNATEVYEQYHKDATSFIEALNYEFSLSLPRDSAKINLLLRKYRDFALQYFSDNKNSLATPLLAMKSKAIDLNEKDAVYNNFRENVKASFYGQQLKRYLKNEKLKLQIAIGKQIPDFKISMPDGKAMSVLAIASKSHYTLLDFWASWCVPCRAAIPKLKEVYGTYHPKGFNVLGISTDKNEVAWKKAMAQDGTKWSHGRDDIDVAEKNIFDIAGIPAYLLIDKDGILIEASFMSNSLSISSSKRFEGKTLESDLKLILEQLINEEKNQNN